MNQKLLDVLGKKKKLCQNVNFLSEKVKSSILVSFWLEITREFLTSQLEILGENILKDLAGKYFIIKTSSILEQKHISWVYSRQWYW